jgi:ribonuclease P protein component
VGQYAFTRNDRLLCAGDFSRVFDGVEARASHRHLLILSTPNNLDHHRLGLVISKKNVRLAANRNRIKRLIRESFRHQPEPESGLDIVVLARKGLDQLDNQDLSSILHAQWLKLAGYSKQ